MKTVKGIKAILDATQRLKRYTGVKVNAKTGKEREYDMVSTRCRVYRNAKGEVVEPDTPNATNATVEYYGVSFSPIVWDSIADTASVLDTVTLKGTLVIPEAGEENYYQGTRRDGTTYESGDLTDALPVAFKASPFKGGKLPKAKDLEPSATKPDTTTVVFTEPKESKDAEAPEESKDSEPAK